MKTKVTIAMAAVLLACGGLKAQYYNDYYHRTGDTIDYKSEIGYYMWWGLRDLLQNNHTASDWAYGSVQHGVHIMPYFTAAPLKIIGIAGCPVSQFEGEAFSDSTSAPEYFYLYDNGTDYGTTNPVFLKRVRWYLPDPHRMLKYEGVWGFQSPEDSCCTFTISTINSRPLYECYFDTAIIVTDTFYVGWSFHSNDIPYIPLISPFIPSYTDYYKWGSFQTVNPCGEEDSAFTEEGGRTTTCFFPIFDYLKCLDTSIASNPYNNNVQWTPYRSRSFTVVYPIIEIDTTIPPFYMCDPVQNVQATPDGDSCALVTWDDFYRYTYCDVQYYAIEEGYGSAQTQTVSGTNLLRICNLDSTKTYAVRVRAFCDTSKIQTDWSPWVTFTLPHTEGIADGESMLSFYTHLMPNPAADRVTVTSSFGLTRIEVYNLQGLLVYSEPAGFTSTTVDLRGWASGQYIMMVHTPRGVTAKKLTVRR